MFGGLSIWQPSVPISSDGFPLALNISDLFLAFPRDRLPPNPFVRFLMKPEVVVLIVAAYLVSKPPLRFLCRTVGIDGTSYTFRMGVASHNASLAVFSFVVFVNTLLIVVGHFVKHGTVETYCDVDGTLWGNSGLGGWATIFYISKYYEFVDTWIIVMKGRSPSTLQVYHHAGVVLSMWGAVASHGAWILIVVLLNSAIHTLMYTYYLVKTLYPEKKIGVAKYLTSAQIIQFVAGISYCMPLHFMGERCDSISSRVVCAFMQIYAGGL
eukprot:CAMPEP_0194285286 /NCGR_PEP_ID=MMETSP0169-20130528/29847_1 /TAXON_ID=218684 /ORGANISM="Corethron pennatum, Strain L29A3" /LENGTH=267 /DNA_ID=CAMNT_0039031375 /DNA_START=176 /DNA_END=975 /DNA_ORIENTATION=+